MDITAFNMMDHLGHGIENMNHSQEERYLPLPEYDLSNPGEVHLTTWGSVVDEAYTHMLMKFSDLPFDEIISLDRIQKGRPIPDNTNEGRRVWVLPQSVPGLRAITGALRGDSRTSAQIMAGQQLAAECLAYGDHGAACCQIEGLDRPSTTFDQQHPVSA